MSKSGKIKVVNVSYSFMMPNRTYCNNLSSQSCPFNLQTRTETKIQKFLPHDRYHRFLYSISQTVFISSSIEIPQTFGDRGLCAEIFMEALDIV